MICRLSIVFTSIVALLIVSVLPSLSQTDSTKSTPHDSAWEPSRNPVTINRADFGISFRIPAGYVQRPNKPSSDARRSVLYTGLRPRDRNRFPTSLTVTALRTPPGTPPANLQEMLFSVMEGGCRGFTPTFTPKEKKSLRIAGSSAYLLRGTGTITHPTSGTTFVIEQRSYAILHNGHCYFVQFAAERNMFTTDAKNLDKLFASIRWLPLHAAH